MISIQWKKSGVAMNVSAADFIDLPDQIDTIYNRLKTTDIEKAEPHTNIEAQCTIHEGHGKPFITLSNLGFADVLDFFTPPSSTISSSS